MTEPIIRTKGREPFCFVRQAILEDARLGVAARVLAAWLSGRPEGWEVHPDHVMRTLDFGKTMWQTARLQLIEAGYLRTGQRCLSGGRFGPAWYEFDEIPQDPPPAEVTGAGFPGSGESGPGRAVDGRPAAGQPGCLPTTPVTPTPRTPRTPPPTGLGAGAPGSGGRCLEVGGAPGANTPTLGARLGEFLSSADARHVDELSAGASADQIDAAEQAIRTMRARGTARDFVAYCKGMARKAALGVVTRPAPQKSQASGPKPRSDLAGHYADHGMLGHIEVAADGISWRTDRGMLAGKDAAKLWSEVDAGMLELRASVPAMGRRA